MSRTMSASSPVPDAPLLRLQDREAFRRHVARHGPPDGAYFVRQAEALVQAGRQDPLPVVAMAETLVEQARSSSRGEDLAVALRARGNLAFLCADYARAVEDYRAALEGFGGDEVERGRTLSSLLHPLAMLGDHEASLAAAEEARGCFARAGDRRRLARLEINLASVWFREDKFHETLAAIERAEAGLKTCDPQQEDTEAWAAIRVTRAVVLINLTRFEEAERAYEEARDYARGQGLLGLAAQAEYNIGYLYFLRGQHVQAIHALDQARETARAGGDKLHLALCDLDQADVCIELHLYADALRLAHSALLQFQTQTMPYEQGKALSNMAVAELFLGHDHAALELLQRAEEVFGAAHNEFWVHMACLYRGVVLLQSGRCFEALPLSRRARAFFEQRRAHTKAIYAGILEARALAAAGDAAEAEAALQRVLGALAPLQAPWLHGQAQMLRGELAEARGERPAALAAYGDAMAQVEAIRGQINFDELRISFLRDRGRIYERAVALLAADEPGDAEAVWRQIERAKSRALAQVMTGGLTALQPAAGAGSRVVHAMQRLREELSWYYRQLNAEESAAVASPGARGVEAVLEAIQAREHELLRAIREMPEGASPLWALEDDIGFRQHLQPVLQGANLVEYFPCGPSFVAVVAGPEGMRVRRLEGERSAVEGALRLLRFQVGGQAMGREHFRRHGAALQQATESHLRLLYELLIAPVAAWLDQPQVVFVPHGMLHALPFVALRDANGWMLDRHRISQAPSGRLLGQMARQPASPREGAVLVAADSSAVREEIAATARACPGLRQGRDGEATLEQVRAAAAASRHLHVAASGEVRDLAPDLAALPLADGRLNVIDIAHLRLQADLVVLSGIGSTLGNLSHADETLGLARAFLLAGARAMLYTLWPLPDPVAAEFCESFYRAWNGGRQTPAAAAHQARMELRRRHAHPFFWAAFQLYACPTAAVSDLAPGVGPGAAASRH
ncbi:MAG: CHAT domain-containing protein [Terriglobales bacterium]